MVRTACLLAALSFADAPDRSPPLPPPDGLNVVAVASADKRLAGYRAPAGLKVEIVAEWGDPVALAFADDGTPVVLDHNKGKPRVVALSASKKGGPFDTARTLVEAAGAGGLLWYDGWLYLGGASVRRVRPAKPGGAYDTKEVLLKGFAGGGARGVALGPDGWLYVSCAAGDHALEGSDGRKAGLVREGGVVRCRPDGSRLHVFATGLRGPAAAAFDGAGHLLLTDGGRRLLHVADGAATSPPLVTMPAGTASGVAIYHDTCLPEELRGLVLVPDAANRVIRGYRTEAHGATLRAVEELELLSAKDEAFRPCQLVTGPDGGLYVASRAGAGQKGRIYRLSWAGTADVPARPLRGLDSWAKLARLKDEALIEALAGSEWSDVQVAVGQLVRRGAGNRPALLKLANDESATAAARRAALVALTAMYDDEVRAALIGALGEEAGLARAAAELLGLHAKAGDRAVHAALLKALSAEDPGVRRAVALAMGRVAGPGAAESVATALSFDDGKDACLREGYLRGLELLGKAGLDALLGLADSGVQKDTDKVVESFAALRSRAAFDAVPALLRSPHVSAAQAAGLIRAAAGYPLRPAPSFDAIVAAAVADEAPAAPVREALLEALARRHTAKGAKAAAWARPLLDDADGTTRARAARASLGTAAGAVEVSRRLLAGSLPRDIVADVIVALRRHAADAEAAAALLRLTASLASPLDGEARRGAFEAAWRLFGEK